MTMSTLGFIRWCARSLKGHLVLFGFTFGVVMSAVFLWLNWTQGTLTVSWALLVVGYSFVGGVIGGALVWYRITRPRMLRLGLLPHASSRTPNVRP
jgi:hypothetical protein